MDEFTRRKLEMGKRALDFCRAHPDPSPRYVAVVARLEKLLDRAKELETLERKQRRLARTPRSAPNGNVISLPKRVEGDPPDPAA